MELVGEVDLARRGSGAGLAGSLTSALASGGDELVCLRRWLEEVRAQLDADDLVVVCEPQALGRQVLRAGNRPIGADPWARNAARYLPVGVHTWPARPVPPSDSRVAAQTCGLALDLAVMRQRSSTDVLTGLRNRAAFDEAFESALANAKRYRWSVAVVVLDLDDFKALNDEFGHAAGDVALQTVANELSALLRRGDTAARLGGDEFGLLLHGIDEDELSAIMGRLQSALTDTPHGDLGFSWGAAFAPVESLVPQFLLQLADERMYERKRERAR